MLLYQVSKQVSKEVYAFYGTGHSMTVSEDNELQLEPLSFFKVPFLSALDLVQTRQVVVKEVSLQQDVYSYIHMCIYFFIHWT